VPILKRIRQAFVSLVSDDSEAHPKAQLTESGKTYEAIRLSVYGVCSNPPRDSNALVFAPSYGGEDIKYSISNDHRNRFKNLKEGEVVVGNYKTQARIFFDEDGNLNVNVPDGNLTATVGGKATLNATEVVINSDTTINGSLTTTGDISGGGKGTFTETVSAPSYTGSGGSGNFQIDQNLVVGGNASFNGTEVTHNTVNIGEDHEHEVIVATLGTPVDTGPPK